VEQSRYRDKAYLVTYELTTDIFEAFGLLVDDIVPVRSVFMLFTDKGVKILKKINYELAELEFINYMLEHVQINGFKNVIGFLKVSDGNYYIEREDGIYTVLDLIDGREANFQDPTDISNVAGALCSFHKATACIGPVMEKRSNLYKWIPLFQRRVNEFLKFKEIAELHEIKTGFDRLFLEYIDMYYEDSIKSVELLKSSAYEKLCSKTQLCGNICHHDLAFHNTIIDTDNNVFFLDFDSCMLDLRIHDVGNLIVRAIKNSGWRMDAARMILGSYSHVDRLSFEELEVLHGFLVFPQDFYDICRSYYMRTKNWEEDDFLSKLQIKTDYFKDRKLFLEGFADIVKSGV
jgi:CotS family spore coat protein